ncbi:hypothetical protein JG688_00016698 [Phytophthora aleatoria]|uniref:Uncharacterized protein n=1 Tax=Phytophthora aleatoria TaxID=2496075 RepID=A0A8J5IXY0_9STRA|nr:hypothetical protein JG688_00016698 [Phytophthora aleatoria]
MKQLERDIFRQCSGGLNTAGRAQRKRWTPQRAMVTSGLCSGCTSIAPMDARP